MLGSGTSLAGTSSQPPAAAQVWSLNLLLWALRYQGSASESVFFYTKSILAEVVFYGVQGPPRGTPDSVL